MVFKLNNYCMFLLFCLFYFTSGYINSTDVDDIPLSNKILSVYWCGFSNYFCGESVSNDVSRYATHVMLAYAKISIDGQILYDQSGKGQVQDMAQVWHQEEKKVLLSVNADWSNAFNNQYSLMDFGRSIGEVISELGIDGIDLNLEDYDFKPVQVQDMIAEIRSVLEKHFPDARKLISVTAECIGVSGNGQMRQIGSNFWKEVLDEETVSRVDLVQVKAYDSWYEGYTGGTSEYFSAIYGQWLAVVKESEKLVLGVLASNQSGSPGYYSEAMDEMITRIEQEHGSVGGVMLWNSYWDARNEGKVSRLAKEALSGFD